MAIVQKETPMTALEKVINDVVEEKSRAIQMFGGFNSNHEAMSVLEEEVYEVRMEVYKKAQTRDEILLYGELIQVAAMAIKWAEQLTIKAGLETL